MADASRAHALRKVTIDTSSWTAITPPIGCNRISIQQTDGANSIKYRTDSADANTERTIVFPEEYVIAANPGSALAIAFDAGTTVGYLQASVGTGPALVDYTR